MRLVKGHLKNQANALKIGQYRYIYRVSEYLSIVPWQY